MLGATSRDLTEEDLHDLDRASAPGLPDYPYAMLEEFSGRAVWDTLGTAGR